MIKWLFLIFVPLTFARTKPQTFELDGLPIQMEWFDVDGDGYSDLVALMLLTKTEGQMDTYFDGGSLRGFYHDETVKEKYLITLLNRNGAWEEGARIDLKRETVLGFSLRRETTVELLLWRRDALVRHAWQDGAWDPKQRYQTPGILATQSASMKEFPFWQQTRNGGFWLVPDLDGIHQVSEHGASQFIAYPELAFSDNRSGQSHRIQLAMPAFFSLDREAGPEMVFQGEDRAMGWHLGESTPAFSGLAEGHLVDVNGDGMADLVRSEEVGDIDKIKDLPKITSRVQTFLAREPLVFPLEPDHEQILPGMILTNGDSDIQLAEPFLDMNGDGRADMLGMAIKLSIFKMVKAAATGRLKIKFLLSLNLQKDDGSFRTLAGGPFEMIWKLNIRRLKMPEFAQLVSDFDGDGWIDIMVEKDSKVEITPVVSEGIRHDRKTTHKLPKQLREPDQVFGKDLNNDGSAEIVMIKLIGGKTRIGVLEVGK